MTKWVNSLNDLFKTLKEDMREVLSDEVYDTVTEVERESVYDVVYNAYEPFIYERRGDDGGLSDPRNMIATFYDTPDGVEMLVQNITKGSRNGRYIAGLVTHGDDNGYGEYEYKYNRDGTAYQYLQPRDFEQDAVDRLKRSKEHVDAMRKGLMRRGYKVD